MPIDSTQCELLVALRAVLAHPYGCSRCHSGKLINPEKGHWDTCGYFLAEVAIAHAGTETDKAEPECSCYEAFAGHHPGCAFYGQRAPLSGSIPASDHSVSSSHTDAEKELIEPHLMQGEVVAVGVRGVVKWYSAEKGYGYIVRDDGGEDIFVHNTRIRPDADCYQILKEGDRVEFDVITRPLGTPFASDVYRLHGEEEEAAKHDTSHLDSQP